MLVCMPKPLLCLPLILINHIKIPWARWLQGLLMRAALLLLLWCLHFLDDSEYLCMDPPPPYHDGPCTPSRIICNGVCRGMPSFIASFDTIAICIIARCVSALGYNVGVGRNQISFEIWLNLHMKFAFLIGTVLTASGPRTRSRGINSNLAVPLC